MAQTQGMQTRYKWPKWRMMLMPGGFTKCCDKLRLSCALTGTTPTCTPNCQCASATVRPDASNVIASHNKAAAQFILPVYGAPSSTLLLLPSVAHVQLRSVVLNPPPSECSFVCVQVLRETHPIFYRGYSGNKRAATKVPRAFAWFRTPL